MFGQNLVFLIISLCFSFIIGVESRDLFKAQTSKLKSYQVVVPQLVQHREKRHAHSLHKSEQEEYSESLTYAIRIEGKEYLLHLKRNKDFLSKNFVEYSHRASGNLVKTYPRRHVHCHYHGEVEGHEESLVALSTCAGLRGVILIGNESYGLEPALQSTANEHLIFPLKDSQPAPFVCGLANETSHHEDHSFHDPSMTVFLRRKRNLPQTRYIELVLVVDNLRFVFKQGNITEIRAEMVQLANLLDRYYKELNIRVVLVGLEIFETTNPFSVDGTAGDVLGRFVRWRRSELVTRIRHDVGQLIVGRSGAYPGGILGMAFVGTVCSVHNAGGINVFSDNSLPYFSTVLAHEMGHNLGMNHDNSRCSCEGSSCIMGASATGATHFSDCSGNYFERLIIRGGGGCLQNQPSLDDVVTVAVCGNGMLEKGEECDCGTPAECKDKCCDADTCTLTPGSACAQGSCCRDCQVRVAGTPCRDSLNSCDLPEFCNGTSPFCPEDYYIMDGLSCEGNTAYCYEGRCQTFGYQCKHLFGSDARKADDRCFKHANTQGNKFGNCGYSGTSLIPCTVDNSMCGKMQCTNFDANAPPDGAVVSVEIIEGGVSCKNADFNLGTDVLDPAYVNTGSVCADGKVCMDFECVNSSALMPQDLACDAKATCSSHGICNDQGNCHCNDGWAPPSCNQGGRGGSINSGPAQIDYSLRNGLLIFFLLVVPILVVIILSLLYVFRRDSLNLCLKGSRSRQHGSRNTPNDQANGNVKMAASSQPPAQIPPETPQPFQQYPSATSWPPHSSEETDYGDGSDVQYPSPKASQLYRQGPGVPKPIPPKQVQ